MKCDPVKITQFFNGELPQPEMESMLDHLNSCPACDRQFKQMLAFKAAAPDIAASLSPQFFEFDARKYSLRRMFVVIAATSVVLVLLVVGLFYLRGSLQSQPTYELATLLEKKPYEYISLAKRGEVSTQDPKREALLAIYSAGEYDRFLPAGAQWLKDHPADHQVAFFCGVAAYVSGNYNTAKTYLEVAILSNNERRPEVLWYLANTLLRLNKKEEARTVLRELSSLRHPYAPLAADILHRLP